MKMKMKEKEIYPEFVLCASFKILHSTGSVFSSVPWMKCIILKDKLNDQLKSNSKQK